MELPTSSPSTTTTPSLALAMMMMMMRNVIITFTVGLSRGGKRSAQMSSAHSYLSPMDVGYRHLACELKKNREVWSVIHFQRAETERQYRSPRINAVMTKSRLDKCNSRTELSQIGLQADRTDGLQQSPTSLYRRLVKHWYGF